MNTAPFIRTRLFGAAGPGAGALHRMGALTSYLAELILEDAQGRGRGDRLEVTLGADVDRAVAACVPFRILECAERLRTGFSRLYQNRLLRDLQASLRRKHRTVPVPPGVDLEAALKARDFFAFDDAYTAPHHGFCDAADYYHRASAMRVIDKISIPALIITAADDPFVPVEQYDDPAMRANPHIVVHIARHGGHQVAQKLTTITLPRQSEIPIRLPCVSSRESCMSCATASGRTIVGGSSCRLTQIPAPAARAATAREAPPSITTLTGSFAVTKTRMLWLNP